MDISKNLRPLHEKKERREAQQAQLADSLARDLKALDREGGEIRKYSKEAINAALHKEFSHAKKALSGAHKSLGTLAAALKRHRSALGALFGNVQMRAKDMQVLYSQLQALESDLAAAQEELYEADLVYHYFHSSQRAILAPGKIPQAEFESYAGALSDFVGELVRRARLDVIENDRPEKNIRIYLRDAQAVYQSLAKFAFSNKSGLRAKLEHLKGYILKLEEMLYDLEK